MCLRLRTVVVRCHTTPGRSSRRQDPLCHPEAGRRPHTWAVLDPPAGSSTGQLRLKSNRVVPCADRETRVAQRIKRCLHTPPAMEQRCQGTCQNGFCKACDTCVVEQPMPARDTYPFNLNASVMSPWLLQLRQRLAPNLGYQNSGRIDSKSPHRQIKRPFSGGEPSPWPADAGARNGAGDGLRGRIQADGSANLFHIPPGWAALSAGSGFNSQLVRNVICHRLRSGRSLGRRGG